MSSAGFMDTRSFKRILNSVLSDSTVGVETITLDVPQMNISGKVCVLLILILSLWEVAL